MTVKLISKTDKALDVAYAAMRTCYSAASAEESMEADYEKKLDLIKKVVGSGHCSTVEHINFTFAIGDISRAASHQLVRHRHASYSHASQRYIRFTDPVMYVPNTISNNKDAFELYTSTVNTVMDCYNALLGMGIKAEDARYVLPNATCSNMVMTLNLRELMHIAGLRLCTRAQKEIRGIVQAMCDEVIKAEPWTACFLQPKCIQQGFCNEEKSCGRMKKLGREDV